MSDYWFEANEEDVAGEIQSVLDAIKGRNESRQQDMRIYASLYKNKIVTGFNSDDENNDVGVGDKLFRDRVSYNVVKMCADTAVSKLTISKPVPKFITAGGNFDVMDKARIMEKLTIGVMRKCDIYRIAADALRDAAIYGIGFIRIQREGESVVCRRVHPSRIIIDDKACLDGEPSVMFCQVDVTREQLLKLFPEDEEMIMGAQLKYTGSSSLGQPMITFTEAWYVGEKGRYVGTIDSPIQNKNGASGVLIDEVWEGPMPIVPIRWQPDLTGYWGIGIAEQLEGIQLEINDVIEKIQINHQLFAVPYMLVPEESGVPDEFFGDNQPGKVIKYHGQAKPEIVLPPAVSPEVYMYLETLYNRAFEIIGISQLSATAQKPQGLNSGIAMRTYIDVESQKFAQISRSWEDLFVNIAKLIVREVARIPGYKILVAEGGKLEKLSMADAKMAEDQYIIQTYPASSLPLTPAGRLDRVIEMLQAQLINNDEAKELLEMPDLEKFNRLANAQYEDFQNTFEYMLRTEDYIEPLPFQNLAMGIQMGISTYLRAKMDGVPEERTNLLIRWFSEASDMLEPQVPETAMPSVNKDMLQGVAEGSALNLPALPK